MNFTNETPFPAMLYVASDAQRIDHKIVVMKVSYRIVRKSQEQWSLELITDGSVPLCMADEYWGEIGESSVRYESDLAPYKPKCDVILNGKAYTQHAKEAEAVAVKLKLSYPEKKAEIVKPQEPKPLNPMMPLTESQKLKWHRELQEYQQKLKQQDKIQFITQIEKTLSVVGESTFKPRFLLPGWKKTSVKKFTELPLRWEYAFGGAYKLYIDPENPILASYNQACFSNPIGVGWIEAGYFKACEMVNSRRKRSVRLQNYTHIASPRIVAHLARQTKPVVYKHPKSTDLTTVEMAKISQKYGVEPKGFGFVGRSWSPRISLSGTYDEKWLEEQHPFPPHDLNYEYWNGAPKDQQIDFFYPNSKLELWNLVSADHSYNGYLSVQFMGHRPYLKMQMATGDMVPWPMVTETVLIDTDAMLISLTHKAWIPRHDPLFVAVEAHFSDQAEGVLFEIMPNQREKSKE